jgi:hypothetical protein
MDANPEMDPAGVPEMGSAAALLNNGIRLCLGCGRCHYHEYHPLTGGSSQQRWTSACVPCRACGRASLTEPLDHRGYHQRCQAEMPRDDELFRCRACHLIRRRMDGSAIHLFNGVHYDCGPCQTCGRAIQGRGLNPHGCHPSCCRCGA